MIIKIHQACSTKNALFYNERKVERQKASFYHCQNMPVMNPFLADKNDRYRIFEEIEERNTRVKKPGLHISVNPTVSDLVKLGDTGIRNEIGKLMEHLGYGHQPYLVYKHADIDRIHFHIVSTRIDCETGKKIKDNYEREKTQRFIKSLEQKYGLTKDENPQKLNYRFSGSSKNLKQNLESLFGQLNQMDFISSKAMYDEALKMFNIEIRPFGKGYAAFVTDGMGNPVRYPIRLSEFDQRPNFYAERNLNQEVTFGVNQKIRFPETFKRELMKALVYQYRKEEKDPTRYLRKRKRIGRNRKGRWL
ncbi:relaxase/mobilization nuclease domain-containing protein [Mangrovibacterium lignilyticum]|uniref:relaxase/mobilization nuclease domain-containing protein n=1 Tax=Mangrovibacterium lignilyticum TaxID=2668052 RepID=UPI0013CFD5C9|nr:relaxase/mobilization nuclease domain-containing protein [Mangrovibacterium lignilyticum]